MLAVHGRRSDGFHELTSVVAPLQFGDRLYLRANDRAKDVLDCGDSDLPCDADNLVLRAVAAFRDATGINAAFDLRLEKRIPVGAGLGGGSSNATATLMALNEWFDFPLGRDQLGALAAGLGSDCPFFLQQRPALLRGRGESVEALPEAICERLSGLRLLLICPPFAIETAWAYQTLAGFPGCDGSQAEAEARLQRFERTACPGDLLFNRFEAVVGSKYLALPTLISQLRNEGYDCLMSGSGSACFILLTGETPAPALIERCRASWGRQMFCVETSIAGPEDVGRQSAPHLAACRQPVHFSDVILPETPDRDEIVLQGIAASPGIAHGVAMVYLQNQPDVPCYEVKEEAVEAELARFDHAILDTRAEITEVRDKIADSLGELEARIFDAHLLVLEDNALLDEVTSELRHTRRNIEYCYEKVAQRYISFFASMEDEYLKERVADIRDVSRRLLSNLAGKEKVSIGSLAKDSLVVSEDISPSEAADMDREKLLGFVTDAGGKTSHAVIMARSLGIPAVVGTHDATERIKNGDTLLVDGHEGVIYVNPSESRLYGYGQLASERAKRDEVIHRVISERSCSRDGQAIELMANVEGAQDMTQVKAMNADGIGLFRTEGIFLRHHGFPSESAQFEEYRKVVEAAEGAPVIIRTLDIGGDKVIDSSRYHEDNSFLGFRAIRFCLGNIDIFKTQLRAILRASSFGDVKLMYPMISGLAELRQANAVLEEVKAELRGEGTQFDESMEVGAMVEVPSAATIIDLLAAKTDFLSIGTNDLIQYLLAVDRLNDRVADLYEPAHPAVLRSLKSIISGGRAAGKPVSVCGEIAGDPVFAALLLGMGAHSLSMTSSILPEVKYFIRKVDSSAARALVDQVLQLDEASSVAEVLEIFRRETMGEMA